VVFTNKTLKYKRNSFNGGFITAATAEWGDIANVEIEKGRYFSTFENQSAIPVVIIGYEVANALFAGEDPLNKVIKIGSASARVIGVQKKAGESIVNIFDTDNSILISYTFAGTILNVKNIESMICLKPLDTADREEFLQEMRQLLRSVRRLKPVQNDNFALNEMTFLLNQTKAIFGGINLAGWIIGGFSILIGGFGIANIMFVSVKERTNLILHSSSQRLPTGPGRRSNRNTMVFGGGSRTPGNESFPMELSAYNVIRGLLISSVIGIVSGLLPAWTAANLNPVDAINSK